MRRGCLGYLGLIVLGAGLLSVPSARADFEHIVSLQQDAGARAAVVDHLRALDESKQKFADAVKALIEALEGRYGDEGYRIRQVIESMADAFAQWDHGIRGLESATRMFSNDLKARLAVGRVYLDRHRVQDALRECAMAIELDGSRADAHALLGLALIHAGRPADAAQALAKATSLNPEDPQASYLLVQTLVRLKADAEAGLAAQGFVAAQMERLDHEGSGSSAPTPWRRPFLSRAAPMDLLEQAETSGAIFPPAIYRHGFRLLMEGEYIQALAALREAATLDPLTASAREATDNLPVRLEAARRAVLAEPKKAVHHEQLGEIYLALNQRENARPEFKRALELDNTSPAARFRLGSLALRDGKADLAVQHLTKAVEQTPTLVEARRILAMAYWADGKHDKSVEQLAAAIALSPGDERLHMALVGSLVTSGRHAEAETALKDAVVALPDSGQARYNLGRLYYTLNRWPEALNEFRAAAFWPVAGLGELQERIASIYGRQMKHGESIDAYRAALAIDPNSRAAHMGLGYVLLQKNRHDEALAEFLAVLLIDPVSTDALMSIGQVEFRRGRYASAEIAVRRALALNSSHAQARYILAQALMRLGRLDEGRKELEEYRRLQTDAQQREHRDRELAALKQEAAARLREGAYDQAITLLRKTVDYDPSGISHMNIGAALLKAGQYEQAVESLRKALDLRIEAAEIHRQLADAYAALGRADDAERERVIYQRMREEQLRSRKE